MKATKKDIVYDLCFPLRNVVELLHQLREDHFSENRSPNNSVSYGEWNELRIRLNCISDILDFVLDDMEAVHGLSCDYAASKFHLFAEMNEAKPSEKCETSN